MLISPFGNRDGQVGETVTWLVATVVILVVLIIAIFASSFYFDGKNKSVSGNENDFSASISFFSWLLTEDDSEISVYRQLDIEGDLNEFNGNLAKEIFDSLYEPEYIYVWVGVDFKGVGFRKNDYFGVRLSTIAGNELNRKIIPRLTERVIVNENKTVELVLDRGDRK